MRHLTIALALPLFVACSSEESANLSTAEIGLNAKVNFSDGENSREAYAAVNLYLGSNDNDSSGFNWGYNNEILLTEGDQLFLRQGAGNKALLTETEVDGKITYTGKIFNVTDSEPVFLELRRVYQSDAFDNFIQVPGSFELDRSIYFGDLASNIPLSWQYIEAERVIAFADLTCHTNEDTVQETPVYWESQPIPNNGTASVNLPNLTGYAYCNGTAGISTQVSGTADNNLHRSSSIQANVQRSMLVVLDYRRD